MQKRFSVPDDKFSNTPHEHQKKWIVGTFTNWKFLGTPLHGLASDTRRLLSNWFTHDLIEYALVLILGGEIIFTNQNSGRQKYMKNSLVPKSIQGCWTKNWQRGRSIRMCCKQLAFLTFLAFRSAKPSTHTRPGCFGSAPGYYIYRTSGARTHFTSEKRGAR